MTKPVLPGPCFLEELDKAFVEEQLRKTGRLVIRVSHIDREITKLCLDVHLLINRHDVNGFELISAVLLIASRPATSFRWIRTWSKYRGLVTAFSSWPVKLYAVKRYSVRYIDEQYCDFELLVEKA